MCRPLSVDPCVLARGVERIGIRGEAKLSLLILGTQIEQKGAKPMCEGTFKITSHDLSSIF